jgi:membrane-anchored protein YejM (alkaline phosphatase superfamily)
VTISPTTNLGGAQNYSNAFLPAAYQATRIGYQGTPVAQARIGNLSNNQTSSQQRQQIDLLQSLNQGLLQRQQVNTELEGVIDSYELAFRMQNSLPQLMDLTRESQKTLEMYGVGGGRTDDFGRQCLMARRFVESGVRFVEVCSGNWDMHNGLRNRLATNCGQIDRPIAALLTDLKQRGLLDDTLVIWGGEFGRTPVGQGADGRNHNSAGFSMWLAGGGVKGGQRVGATDDYGARAVDNRVHHHDLHATVLHLMGLDHQRLTYRYGGRDYSLTDIHGRVVREVLA